MNTIQFKAPRSEQEFDQVRHLFREYAASIDFEAGFRNFEDELNAIATDYAEPTGALILAYHDDSPVGCVGIKQMGEQRAELKRFYVQPAFRQFKIGTRLLALILAKAGELDFKAVCLEVIPTLTKAKAVYDSFEFQEIAPYKSVDFDGTVFMERRLKR